MKNLLLTCALLMVACAEPTIKDGDIETLFTKEREITETSRISINEALRSNNPRGFVGKYAILQINDRGADFNFYVVDIESGEVVNKLFSVGRGRNEMMYPFYLGESNGQIWFVNQMRNEILSIPTEDILTRSSDLKPTKIAGLDRKDGFYMSDIAPIANNRFVAYKSIKEDNSPSLVTVNIEDNELQAGEAFSWFGEGDNDENKHYAYSGNFQSTSNGDAMLYTTTWGVCLHFYDCKDTISPPSIIKEYIVQRPKIVVEESRNMLSIHPTDDTHIGFSYAGTDDENFYLRYNKMALKEWRELPIEERSLSTILVFEKDGTPKEKLSFPEQTPMSTVKYCKFNNSLYRLDYDDEGNDCLVQYEL